MALRYCFASITRISRLPVLPFEVKQLPKRQWEAGDYVVGQVNECAGHFRHIEIINGRMVEVCEGDLIVGAFGIRAATLEAVGDWKAIGRDLRMDAMTAAGLFGRVTSRSPFLPPPLPLTYLGHVLVEGKKLGMRDSIPCEPERPFRLPVVLVIGSSMSAGKTTSCRVIVRELKRAGLKIIAAKLTGAARYRDVLSMGDAGADHIFDFVDAGLPSTVCPEDEFRSSLRQLLSRMAGIEADVMVAEAGASPLEPYNGATAVEELSQNIRCTLLCASDPYAVVGVMAAFKRTPDLVTGGAANTEAAVQLVKKLCGLTALDLQDSRSLPQLRSLLQERLRLGNQGG